MSLVLENPAVRASNFTVSADTRGTAAPSEAAHEAKYTIHSTLEELPGHTVILDSKTTGAELDRLFAERTDLPGVILLEQGELIGVISQSHYYKCVSRAFGREIYQGRSATLMLEAVKDTPLMLTANCLVQIAVEHCLARPLHLVYEPFLIYHEDRDEYRLCSFQVLLLASSHIAALRNGQMAQILNSVTDGLLIIDRTFQIGSEYSRAAAQLFERTDLEQFSFLEILAPLVDPVTHGQIADYLKILFDPKLIDKLIKSINPTKQIAVRFPLPEEHVKYFSVNFERVRTQSEISQVLVRVEDVTQRMNLAKELEKQEAAAEEKLQFILQVLGVDPVVLKEFIHRFEQELAALDDLLQSGAEGDLQEKIRELFRMTHTLKGEAALLRLRAYERPLHRLEDVLETLRGNPELDASHLASLIPACEVLRKLDDQMRQARSHLDQLLSAKAGQAVQTVPLEPLPPLALMARLIEDLGKRLGKQVAFHTTVRDEDLPAPHREIIRELLLHLARNSMVHGIESAPEREARGKSPGGAIQFAVKSHPDFHELIFQDDGGGLNYKRILHRAAELGMNLTTRDEAHEAIFAPGFSTAENVSDLAGRGVGLDALRHSLQQAGGSIHVYSEEGAYCAFQIVLPRQKPGGVT